MSDTLQDYKQRMEKAENLFRYSHLPPHLQEVSKPFFEMATKLVDVLPNSPEATLCLRKLWEAKNLAVYATVEAKENQN